MFDNTILGSFFRNREFALGGFLVDDDRNIINPDVKIQPFWVVVFDCNSHDNFAVWHYATLSAVFNYFLKYTNLLLIVGCEGLF